MNQPKSNVLLIPEFVNKLIIEAKKDSNNVELQMQIVDKLDSLGMHKQALITIDKLIRNDSLNNNFWLKRGQISKQIEDTASAIKAFRYATKIYPTPMALMELANLYAETKNPLTIYVCNQLIKNNPGGNYNAQAYFFIGVYYSKIKDNKSACIAFDKSIGEDFHFEQSYIEKGYLFFNEKKYKEAMAVFEQVTKINQTSADGYYWQAKCYELLNNSKKAIEFYTKTLLLDNNLTEAKISLDRLNK